MDSNVVSLSGFLQQKEEERALPGVPLAQHLASSFTCPETGTAFPLLYAASYPNLEVSREDQLVFCGSYSTVYQLSPRIKGQNAVLAYPRPEMASFFTLDADEDCWLEVFDLKTASGIAGFMMLANRLTRSEDEFDVIHSSTGSFGLLVRRDLPQHHGRIVYHSSETRPHPIFDNIVFRYVHVLEADGSVSQGDPLGLSKMP